MSLALFNVNKKIYFGAVEQRKQAYHTPKTDNSNLQRVHIELV